MPKPRAIGSKRKVFLPSGNKDCQLGGFLTSMCRSGPRKTVHFGRPFEVGCAHGRGGKRETMTDMLKLII